MLGSSSFLHAPPSIAMAGLDTKTPLPTEIKLHQASRVLELVFPRGIAFRLSCEFLRVNSPSVRFRQEVGTPSLTRGLPSGCWVGAGTISGSVICRARRPRPRARTRPPRAHKKMSSERPRFGFEEVSPEKKTRRVRGVFDS